MLNFFDRVEREIEILFEHYYELQNILVIMGAFIFVLFVVIIVNAHKINKLEKELSEFKKENHNDL